MCIIHVIFNGNLGEKSQRGGGSLYTFIMNMPAGLQLMIDRSAALIHYITKPGRPPPPKKKSRRFIEEFVLLRDV